MEVDRLNTQRFRLTGAGESAAAAAASAHRAETWRKVVKVLQESGLVASSDKIAMPEPPDNVVALKAVIECYGAAQGAAKTE